MPSSLVNLGIFWAAWLTIVDCQGDGGLEGRYDTGNPYCFKFTWLGPKSEEINNSSNGCATVKGQPCFQPLVSSNDSTLPNVNHMWDTMNTSQIACHMRQGYVCIKYTYNYNNAVLNISYFCGKMMEDKSSPVVDGCYTQKVDSHIIEACACKSNVGGVPCNLSTIIHASMPTILLFIILSWIFVNN